MLPGSQHSPSSADPSSGAASTAVRFDFTAVPRWMLVGDVALESQALESIGLVTLPFWQQAFSALHCTESFPILRSLNPYNHLPSFLHTAAFPGSRTLLILLHSIALLCTDKQLICSTPELAAFQGRGVDRSPKPFVFGMLLGKK